MDEVKFTNAVLYLLQHAPGRPGLMHLLKMLFLVDYEHYRRYLSPVTGAQYVALPDGPVIDDYKRRFDQLLRQGVLDVQEAPVPGRQNKKVEYLPRLEADPRVFKASELAVMGAVVRQHGAATGVGLSQKTHLQGPWSLAWDPERQGQPIPYMLFRWHDNLPDQEDIEAARQSIYDRRLESRIAALNGQPST